MRDPTDRLVSDTDSILKETKNFYESLYTAEDNDPTAQEEMFAHIDKTITEEQNKVRSSNISKREILEAITSMQTANRPAQKGCRQSFIKHLNIY